MPRRDPAPRDTRERISKAALEVFGEIGFAAASPEDIAARAGVTKGAFYYYFADKADLARDLQDQILARLQQQALQAFDPNADTIANLERCFMVYLTALDELGTARFFLRDTWSLGPSPDAGEQGIAILKDVLDEGVRRGDLLPLDTTALASILRGAFTDATLHILSGGDDEQTVAIVGRIVRAFAPSKVKARR